MCGLLIVNKPKGITSFGVVSRIRKLTGERRVGHTGTLDPMAEGVLPVLIGRATKLSDYMLCADKCYKATVKLGITTDTLDITGEVLSEREISVTNEQIDDALKRFTGELEQTPPMFSAIKKDGVRMYKLAREGKEVDIPPRNIRIFSIKRESDIDESFEFNISCHVSKGTYIRSLVRDIGEYLGTGAVLSSLIRTKTAGFGIEDSVSLEKLDSQNIGDYILPPGEAVSDLSAVSLTEAQAIMFSNGRILDLNRLPSGDFCDGETVRVNCNGELLGLATADIKNRELKIKCLIDPLKKE